MQKLDEKHAEKAKEIFKGYLDENNIINNTVNSLSELTQINIEYLKTKMEEIIFTEPKKLKKHITSLSALNQKIKDFNDSRKKSEDYTEEEKDIKTLINIFNNTYEKFSEKKKGKAYEVIKTLGIRACPYCNLNYIDSIMDDTQKILRPPLDHYYSKSIYPYLAISFYNLIPSCPACNSSLKLDKNFFTNKHIYPYLDSFDDCAKFVVNIEDLKTFYNDLESFNLDIEINISDKSDEIKQMEKTFKLIDRYNYHKDIVQELLLKKKIYTKEYIDEIAKLLKVNEVADFSESAIELFITGNYTNPEHINKRPLAKLTKDIWNLDN